MDGKFQLNKNGKKCCINVDLNTFACTFKDPYLNEQFVAIVPKSGSVAHSLFKAGSYAYEYGGDVFKRRVNTAETIAKKLNFKVY